MEIHLGLREGRKHLELEFRVIEFCNKERVGYKLDLNSYSSYIQNLFSFAQRVLVVVQPYRKHNDHIKQKVLTQV